MSKRTSKARLNASTKKNTLPKPRKARPRILWANSYCLLDTSSGVSISVRQILIQLEKEGFEIEIVGATNFDAPTGIKKISEQWDQMQSVEEPVVNLRDGPLLHRLVKTKSTFRSEMSEAEASDVFQLYLTVLDRFEPDLVFYYGGQPMDYLIASEARVRNIPTVAYLVNANYVGKRWCRDVDLIVTDTKATADFYKKTCGFIPYPIGKFIDRSQIIARTHSREKLTFVNPSWAKGAGLVAQLAVVLEQKRPDIQIEVVESRGDWNTVLKDVMNGYFKQKFRKLNNVTVTPNTSHMGEVFSRSRVLLAPSFWWESGSRVIAEAMINGIPTVTTDNGGGREMVGDGGIILTLPNSCHQSPYNALPNATMLEEIIKVIEQLWDNELLYLNLMTKALAHGVKFHSIDVSTKKLVSKLNSLIAQRNKSYSRDFLLKQLHRHSLTDERITFGLTAEEKSKTENKELLENTKEKENSFQWKNSPTKKNSVLVNKFVFFWVGQEIPMIKQFVESIRWQYGETAQITQISDHITKKISGVNEVKRFDCPEEMMFARMKGYSLIEDGKDYIAFYDTDTLFLNTIRVPVRSTIDHFLITRTNDFIMNHHQRQFEYYPEFVGKNVKDIMLYIGGCIITKKPQELFNNLLNIYKHLPDRMHRWYGDQVALHKFGMSNPINLTALSEENYLKSFGDNISLDLLLKMTEEKVFNIHFKGHNEKKYFAEWYNFLKKQRDKN